MPKKLTPEDRKRIIENLKKSKIGSYLYKRKEHVKGFFNIICLIPFIVLTIGIFLPTSFSINIPYPLSLFLGHTYHGFTTYSNGDLVHQIQFSKIATHHISDISMMDISYFVLVYLRKSLIYPLIEVIYLIAIHEYSWWISYIIAHFQLIFLTAQWEQIYFSNNLTLIYGIGIFSYVFLIGWTKNNWKWLSIDMLVYAFWIITGFMVTYDFNGATIYLNNGYIIGLEELSWIIILGSYLIIRGTQKRIKMSWLL